MNSNYKNEVSSSVLKAGHVWDNNKKRLPFSELPYAPNLNKDSTSLEDSPSMDTFSCPEKLIPELKKDPKLKKNFEILENCGFLSGGEDSLSKDYTLGKKLPLFPFRYDSWGRFMRSGYSLNYCPTPVEALALLNGEEVELPDVPEEFEDLMEDEFDLFLMLPSLESESPEMTSLFWGDPIECAVVDSVEGVTSNKYGVKFDTDIASGMGQNAFKNLSTRLSSQGSNYVPWGVLKPCEDGESYKLDSDSVRMFEGRPADSILHEVLPSLSEAWKSHPLSTSRPFLPSSINFGGHQIGVSMDSSCEFSVEESIENFNVWFNPEQDFDKNHSGLGVYKLDGGKPVSQWDNRIFNSLLRRIEISWSSALLQTGNYETHKIIGNFLKTADKGDCRSAKEFFDILAEKKSVSREEAVAGFKNQINLVLQFEKQRQECSHNPLAYVKSNMENKLYSPMVVSYEVPVNSLTRELKNYYNRTSFISQSQNISGDGDKASTSIDVVFSTGAEALRRGVCKPWEWPRSLELSKNVTYVDLKDYLKNLPLSNNSLDSYLKDLEVKMDNNMVQFDASVDQNELDYIVSHVSRLREASKAGLIVGGEHPSVGVAHILGNHQVPNSRIGVVGDLVEELKTPIKGMDSREFCKRIRSKFKDLNHIKDSLIYWNSPKGILGVEDSSKFLPDSSNLNLEIERWLLPLIGDKVALSNLNKVYGSNIKEPLRDSSKDFTLLRSELDNILKGISKYSDHTSILSINEKNKDDLNDSVSHLLRSWFNLNDTDQFFNMLKKFAVHSPFEEDIAKIDNSSINTKSELYNFIGFISSENSWKDLYSYLNSLNDVHPIILNGVPFEKLKDVLESEKGNVIDLNTVPFEELKNSVNNEIVLNEDSRVMEINLNDIQITDLEETLKDRNNIKEVQNLRFELFNTFNSLHKLFNPIYQECPNLLITEMGSKMNPRVLKEVSSMLYSGEPLSELCKEGSIINTTIRDLNDLLIGFSGFENDYKSCKEIKNISNSIAGTLKEYKQFKGLSVKTEGSKTIVGGLGGLYYKMLSEAYPKELSKIKFEYSEELGTEKFIYSATEEKIDFSSEESLTSESVNKLRDYVRRADVQRPSRVQGFELSK